ncbi:MAG: hypothetical protein IJK98_02480 [Clostridia bacterium]|nr:hypothetical protein [Clostridia bacterium]
MKCVKLLTALLLIACVLLAFAGCLKYTGNILEVTAPGAEISAFTTAHAATTAPNIDPTATTLPGTSEAVTANPADTATTAAAPVSTSDPSTWSVQQIVDYVNQAMTQTRAYTGALNADHNETITATLTKAPGGSLVQSIANPIIEGAIKPTNETLAFSNGQAVDSEKETVPILLPKKSAFLLEAAGVASASAHAEGTDTVVEIAMIEETGTLDTPPRYNSTAIGYLNAGMVDLSAVTITSCDIHYTGSTMKLRINPNGYVVTADYYVPFVVEAAGKAMFMSAEVTCEGSDSESWVLKW